MKRIVLFCLLMLLTGCFDMVVKKDTVRPDLEPPQEKSLSFQSKEALASGATLQNVTANKVYYEGTEPKSEEAKVLLDMSYRFMGLLGVRTDFDPSDPASVKAVFEKADKAIEEKDRIIYDLQEQVKEYNRKLVTAKEANDAAVKEHKTFKEKVWSWIWGIIGFVLLVVVILGLLQMFTGIPFLSGIAPWVMRRLHDTSKKTVAAIQEERDYWEDMAENGGSDEEKTRAKGVLGHLNDTLEKHQKTAPHVKSHIRKLKEKM